MRNLLYIALLLATSSASAMSGCLKPPPTDTLFDVNAITSIQERMVIEEALFPVDLTTNTLYNNGVPIRSALLRSDHNEQQFDTYTYNAQGQLTSIKTHSDEPRATTYTYDAQGRMTSEGGEVFKSTSPLTKPGVFTRYVCSFPKAGVVQQDRIDGPDEERVIGEFDAQGRMTRLMRYTASRGQSLRLANDETYQYLNGLLSTYRTTTYAYGKLYSTSVGTYDAMGRLSSVESKRPDGRTEQVLTIEYTKVDERGNWTLAKHSSEGTPQTVYYRTITYNR